MEKTKREKNHARTLDLIDLCFTLKEAYLRQRHPGHRLKNPPADSSRRSGAKGETVEIAKEPLVTLKSLCILLRDACVEFCLIGGLAVAVQATPRAAENRIKKR